MLLVEEVFEDLAQEEVRILIESLGLVLQDPRQRL